MTGSRARPTSPARCAQSEDSAAPGRPASPAQAPGQPAPNATARSVAPAPAQPAVAPEPASGALAEADALSLLSHGELELEGRLVDASNTTLRAFVTGDGVTVRCVYKPVRGERPLWDFPDGTLAGREVAAYLVSQAAGWQVVPPTVLRDGPLGPGACQLWIEETRDADPLVGFVRIAHLPDSWLKVMAARDEAGRPYALAHADDPRLTRLAVFDAVINNADRKGGHVLVDPGGGVYGVDHGLSFHVEDKLRTVLWGWADDPLPEAERATLDALAELLAGELAGELLAHVTSAEVAATRTRVERLRAAGRFPLPPADWPAVPWPPI